MACNKKYKLLKSDVTYVNIHHQTIKLYRIMALKRIVLCNGEVIDEGTLGGYMQSYDNLSQQDTCWVDYRSTVYGSSRIKERAIVCNSIVENSDIFGASMVSDSEIERSTIEKSLVEKSSVHDSDIYDCTMKSDAYIEYAKMVSSVVVNEARVVCSEGDNPKIRYARKPVFSNCFLSAGARIKSNSDYVNIQAHGISATVYKNKDMLSDMFSEYMFCFMAGKNVAYGVVTEFEKMMRKNTNLTVPIIDYINELAYDATNVIKQTEIELEDKEAKDNFSYRIEGVMKSISEKDLEHIAEEIMLITKDYVPCKEVRSNDKKI